MGNGVQRVDAALVHGDLESFSKAASAETIKFFVNKRAAHWDEKVDPRVRLGDVDEALNILQELVDKYTRLLTGSGSAVGPALSPDWKAIFKIPWIDQSR